MHLEIKWKTKMDQGETEQISHLAIDIGGTLIKMVYLSRSSGSCADDGREKEEEERSSIDSVVVINGSSSSSNDHHSKKGKSAVLEGRLNFTKFETCKIDDCLDFIKSKELCLGGFKDCGSSDDDKNFIKATGGGALKFGDLFKEKLGISLDRKDEMDCLVKGANFLLKEVQHEAFTYIDGQKEFVKIDHHDLYPYLLVNIGSGVSLIKVTADGEFERVSGTSVGGGTFLGLGRLLTECKGFDELLELSLCGNNRAVDMLVGDIYGGLDYSKIGLSSTAIASSFGKAVSHNKELEDYKPEDMARSLLRMISNNIGQISYLNAIIYGLKRIFFGGFFIRGHPYTMDTISVAVNFWSKGEAKAMFLQHEGFLGALGAFTSYEKHGLEDLLVNQSVQLPQNGDLNEH